MNPEDAVVLWIDNGLFVDFAIRCAPGFRKSFYWSPWISSFPKSNSLLVGDGFDEIERVQYLWDYVAKADLVICPDVYSGDVQTQLVKMGKRVFGSRHGDDIELFRDYAKEVFGQLGLPVAPWKLVIGLDNLRSYLKEHENQWVKVSTVRGDFETFHSPNYDLIEPRLDELEWKLGAKKYIYEFIVEAGIDGVVEIGFDGLTVDGEYPANAMTAYEAKDVGMIGTTLPYKELSEPVRLVNEKLSPYFKKMEYRGFFASEIRYGEDGIPFLIDPCCRAGTPSNELLQEFFMDWPQIFMDASEGKVPKLEPTYKYGVIAMVHSAWSNANWQALTFPDEVRQFIKLRNHTRIKGKDYVVPTEVGLPEIGAVVGLGDTMEEAINHLNENASQLEGYDLDIKLDAIPHALETVQQGKEFGIGFGDGELPEPADAVELIGEQDAAK